MLFLTVCRSRSGLPHVTWSLDVFVCCPWVYWGLTGEGGSMLGWLSSAPCGLWQASKGSFSRRSRGKKEKQKHASSFLRFCMHHLGNVDNVSLSTASHMAKLLSMEVNYQNAWIQKNVKKKKQKNPKKLGPLMFYSHLYGSV